MDLLKHIKQTKKVRKVLLAGSGAVGKTSLVKVLKSEKSLNNMNEKKLAYHRTPYLNLDVISSSTEANTSNKLNIQMYDVAGQLDLPFHALRDTINTTLGSVDLVMLVFSNDNIKSLLNLTDWVGIIDRFFKQNQTIPYPDLILVRNKYDLPGTIDNILVQQLLETDKKIIRGFEISCLTGTGIKELKSWLIKHLFEG